MSFSFWHFFLAIDIFLIILENKFNIELIIYELLIKIFCDYNFSISTVLLLKIYKIDKKIEFNPGEFNNVWTWYLNFFNKFKISSQDLKIKIGVVKTLNKYGEIEEHCILYNENNNSVQPIIFFNRFFTKKQLDTFSIFNIKNEYLEKKNSAQFINFNNITTKDNIFENSISTSKLEANYNIRSSEQKFFLYFTICCLLGNILPLYKIENFSHILLSEEEKKSLLFKNKIFEQLKKESPYELNKIKINISYWSNIFLVNPNFFNSIDY